MTRYVAFLRAINVGGHTVKMDRLRELFGQLELDRVQTFIASGNVIFEAELSTEADRRALEGRIEDHLQAALGFAAETFLRAIEELEAVGNSWFFEGDGPPAGTTHFVAFLRHPPEPASRPALLEKANVVDGFHIDGCEVHWLRRGGHDDSKFSNAVLEKLLGQPATMRNVNTVRKIAAKFGT